MASIKNTTRQISLLCTVALTLAAQSAVAAGRPNQAPFLPAGQPMAAPTAFLEMCARAPSDCAQSDQADENRIVNLARQAMVAKYEQAFAHRPEEPIPGTVSGPFFSPLAPRPFAPSAPIAGTNTPDTPDYARTDLTPDMLKRIKAVNRNVNRRLVADTDAHIYHINDYWDAPALTPGARGDCEDFALVKRRQLIEQGIPAAALSLAIVRTRYDEDHAVLVVSTLQGDIVLDNLAYSVKPWARTGYTWISRQAPGDALGWVSLSGPAAAMERLPDQMQVATIR